MITIDRPTWRDTIDALLSILETGRPPSVSAYSTATVLADGAGISYGLHQATDRAGTLDAVVLRYLDLGGALADELRPHLPRLERDETTRVDPSARWVVELLAALRRAGADPLMQRAQREVFDALYWEPMAAQARAAGVSLPLSLAVLYDTAIQSGPAAIASMRSRFPERAPVRGGDERAWTRAYLRARRAWLASFVGRDIAHTALVRRTVYRVDALQALVDAENWSLARPIRFRGHLIA